jgi:uncharacterized membrane protein YccC
VSTTAEPRPWKEGRLYASASHSLAPAIASLLSYWLATHALSRLHSLSKGDDLLGGLWAVLATLFVYRESHRQSVTAAVSRASATLVSFLLCLVYLLVFSFHPLGLAVLIGVGAFLLMMIGRDEDVITAGISTTVVLVAAALSPHRAWQQPILRLADTALGIAVGVGAFVDRVAVLRIRATLPRSAKQSCEPPLLMT